MIDEKVRQSILAVIGTGEENKTSTAEIILKTGLKERQIRKAVHDLRIAGVLICSSTAPPGGYFLPTSPEEVRPFVKSMSRRGKSVFAAASSAREKAGVFDGQLELLFGAEEWVN